MNPRQLSRAMLSAMPLAFGITTGLAVAMQAESAASTAPVAAATSAPMPRPNICGPDYRRRRSADVDAICASGRRWIEVFRAGDIDGLMRLYMPNAQVALHGQPKLLGLGAIRAYFAPALAARPDVAFLLDVEDIQVQGDVAWLISRYWYTSIGKGGSRHQDAGRSLLIYRRDRSKVASGEWKIQVDIDQGSPDIAFPAPSQAR